MLRNDSQKDSFIENGIGFSVCFYREHRCFTLKSIVNFMLQRRRVSVHHMMEIFVCGSSYTAVTDGKQSLTEEKKEKENGI